MIKRITALLLTICLILSAVSVKADAADGQRVTANAVTVAAGHTTAVTLEAENFQNIAALDVYVYYDASVFTVSDTSDGWLLSGAQSSVNTTEGGVIKLSVMSLEGLSGSGSLLTLYFSTKATCAPGTYPVTVAIGRAYDANLSAAHIDGVNGWITVDEPVETEPFYLQTCINQDPLRKGDTLVYQVWSNWSPFVSGEFVVKYNHEIYAYGTTTLEPSLTGEGAFYSINALTPGQIRIAYANDDPVSIGHLFTVELTVIADIDAQTTVSALATNMYRPDLSAYLPFDTQCQLTLEKLPPVMDCPDAFLQMDRLVVGAQSVSQFCLEAGAGVAAADFTITYDPTTLRCASVEMADGLEDKGGMLVVNESFTGGTICFSYVNLDAYDVTDLPLVKIIWEPLRSPQSHYEVTCAAVGVVDLQQKEILLEYVTATGCIYHTAVVTEPSCTEPGYTTYACTCGERDVGDYVDAAGHTEEPVIGYDPTCTEPGLTDGTKCSICDESIVAQEPIEVPGHVEVPVIGYGPTCTEPGLTDGTKCSVCDEPIMAQEEIPVEPHNFEGGSCSVCGAPEVTYLLGDVNLDGSVDSMDTNILFRYANGDVTLGELSEAQLLAADVNGDGSADSMDTNILFRYANEDATLNWTPVEIQPVR